MACACTPAARPCSTCRGSSSPARAGAVFRRHIAHGPVVAPLVYVGYGIPRGGKGTGDYEKLEKKVEGAIVVALAGGPDDPHLGQAETRAAEQGDRGARSRRGRLRALGSERVRRSRTTARPPISDCPRCSSGRAGSAALVQAFVGKARGGDPIAAGLAPGSRSRRPGTLQTPVERVVLGTANVAGRLRGSGKSDRTIVVGAHMDHLGLGTDSSLAPGERAIHNGADDNASGVAVMLEVCQALAKLDAEQRPFDVVCIAFGAEEMGLLGSKHYVQTLPKDERGRIAAMLNFDMVGRLGPDGLIVAGAGTSKVVAARCSTRHKHELTVRTTDDGYGPSDHGSFYEAQIPVLHFFTGPHEDYHKPSDDLDKLDFDGAAKVGALALAIVTELEAKSHRARLRRGRSGRPSRAAAASACLARHDPRLRCQGRRRAAVGRARRRGRGPGGHAARATSSCASVPAASTTSTTTWPRSRR